MGSGTLLKLGASSENPGKAGKLGVCSPGVNLGTPNPEKAMLWLAAACCGFKLGWGLWGTARRPQIVCRRDMVLEKQEVIPHGDLWLELKVCVGCGGEIQGDG